MLAAALVALALSALGGCSLGNISQEEPQFEELPMATFADYSHTVVVRGHRNLVLKAAKAEIYDQSKKAVLSGVAFSEYDPDTGELLSLGRADSAIYHTDTKDAEFSGSVRLESKKQDAILEGEFLKWIDSTKRLEGRLDRTVTIARSDGSSLSGAGFEAEAKSRSFSFRESVNGRVVSEPEDGAK